MKKYKMIWLLSLFILFGLFDSSAYAGEATDRIKAATDKLVEIFSNKKLEPPEMADERARLIREAVDTAFDWVAFSQRALGPHWKKLSKDQKKEFVYLFGQLIEQTYMDKTRLYSDEKMIYLGEKLDEKYGIVDAAITRSSGSNIDIQFRIIKNKNEKWFVYDIHIEGVSLVNNYRSQFNNFLIRSGYSELISKLKTKLEENPYK